VHVFGLLETAPTVSLSSRDMGVP